MKTRNLFVTFEGIDGCGKGKQLENFLSLLLNDENDFLGDKYSTVWITREPTKLTKAGKAIAQGIRQREVGPLEAAKKFVDDRIEHTDDYILPRYYEGSWILSSRYDFSTLSYQLTQGLPFSKLYDMHQYEAKKTIVPDITLLFDVPVEVALKRTAKRNGIKEQYEKESFQRLLVEKQEEALNELLRRQPERNIIRINGNQTPEKVAEEMQSKIEELVQSKEEYFRIN